ncbi:Uncharacterised protein [Mycobacterium tuberculosis]|nr:Uncharacterised protein [Mycobacterium tuberculosis]
MANPCPPWDSWKLSDAAVFIPTTCPRPLTTGPPESPGWIAASNWINPFNVSSAPVSESDACTVWPSATTLPGTARGVPPCPPLLPIATTGSPTATPPPIAADGRPPAPRSCSTATSWVRSYPTTSTP